MEEVIGLQGVGHLPVHQRHDIRVEAFRSRRRQTPVRTTTNVQTSKANPASRAGDGGLRPARLQKPRGQRVWIGLAVTLVVAVFGTSVALARDTSGTTSTAPSSADLTPPSTVPTPTTTSTPTTASTPTAVATPEAAGSPTPPPTSAVAKRARANRPVLVDGVPQVKVTPGAARVGARVRVEGFGFTAEQWAAPNAPVWLALASGCGLYAQAQHSLRVVSGGRLAGEITVPARGECRQSDRADEPVPAGRYRIAYSCTGCFIGEIKVIPGPSATTSCRDVAFRPNSDDVAGSIVARNMPCTDAEALVRKIGTHLGFNGNATAHADGFSCQRTGREDRTLPVAFYRCTNGSRQVTFNRS